MSEKPTYEELERKIKQLEKSEFKRETFEESQARFREINREEKLVQESAEKIRGLVESSQDWIWEVDAKGVYVYASPQVYDLLGYEPKEIVGKPLFDFILADDKKKIAQKFISIVKNPRSLKSLEKRCLHKNGDVVIIETNGSPIFSETGKFVGFIGVNRNITESKQAEEELLESEQKHRLLIENLNDLVVKFDSRYRIIYASPNYCETFGKVENELIGNEFTPLIHPDDVPTVRYSLSSLADSPHTTYHEERAKTIHGWRWFGWSAKAVLDKDCKIKEIISIGRDITELRQIEKSLHESKLILDNISDIAYISDTEGKVTYVNPAAKKIIGLTLEEIINRPFLPLFIEKDHKSLLDVYKRTLKGESLENNLTFISGITCHFTSLPLKDDLGNIIGTFGIARDISDRLKSENALAESETRLKKAQSVANIGNWEYDISTGKIWGSEQAFQIYGIERTSPYLPLEKVEASIPDAPRVNQALVDLIQESIKYDIEFEVHREIDGKIILIHSIAELVLKNEVPIKVLGIIHDITEQRKIEKQLQKAQRMDSIGNLAGGIAHDFNNLLYPIIGMSEMLMEDLTPGSLEYENAEEILKAGKRGSDLVKQISAFSRQSEHKMIPVKIQQILKEVINLSRSTIPSNIEIDQNIQSNCGLVKADSTQIHQVAMNLITNAYHAVEENGGKISVQLSETTIDVDDLDDSYLEPGQYIELSVSDTGIGIEPGIIDNIFEPYFTTKKKGKGTGLGLATVYGIVKEHNGGIKVYSNLGEGATFKVFFPLVRSKPEAKVQEHERGLKGGTERILLVDDEESVVLLEKQILERLGYQVEERSSSVDALKAFKVNPNSFDLVIADMTMPSMTGDQLAKELISIRPDIPIIICTGFSERINKEKAKAIGIKGYLMKPVLKSEMAQIVRKVLDEVKCNKTNLT